MRKNIFLLAICFSTSAFASSVQLGSGESILIGDTRVSCGSDSSAPVGKYLLSKNCTCKNGCGGQSQGYFLCLTESYSDGSKEYTSLHDFFALDAGEMIRSCNREMASHPSCR